MQGVIPTLITLLREPHAGLCSSAAGVLQNLCRDPGCRASVVDGGGVEPLSDLVVSSDPRAQACAAGALLNVVGQSLPRRSRERALLLDVLSDAIALGAVLPCLLDECAPDAAEAST
jgi:hypothetical protein